MFTFQRKFPEETGILSRCIFDTLKELDEKNVPMHSFLLMKNDSLIFEKYYAPYREDTLHRMFSISKSFTAIAISLLMDEGKIDADTSITEYFPEYCDENTHPWIRATTVRNMLMMRTCHASTTYKVDMKSDWVRSFFTVPPTHKPGTVFHYDTSSAHVLCALAEKLSGMDMLDYLKEKILNYMSFSKDSYMVKDPFGVSMGGSGLMATPMDVLKVLYVLHHRGTIRCADGITRTLISPSFIDMATANLSDTLMTAPLPSEAQGYGMQIWRNEKGGFVLYGMGGQLAISLPDEDMLIMTTADTQGMQGGNQLIYNAIYNNLLCTPISRGIDSPVMKKKLTPDEKARDRTLLMEYAESLKIAPPRLPESYANTTKSIAGSVIPSFIREISKANEENGHNSLIDRGSITPLVSTSEPDNEAAPHSTSNQGSMTPPLSSSDDILLCYALNDNPQGFEELTLSLSADALCAITFRQKETLHTINFGIQSMCEGLFPIYQTPYTAGGIFTRDNVLYVRVHLIGESVGSVHFQFFFEENDITVFARKIEETYFKEFDGHFYGVITPVK